MRLVIHPHSNESEEIPVARNEDVIVSRQLNWL